MCEVPLWRYVYLWFLFPIWFSGITLQFILYCVSGSFDYFSALQLHTVEWALWFVSSCACVWELLPGLYLEAKLLVHRLCVSRWNVARSFSRVALDISAPSSTESSYCFICLQSLTISFWIFANWNSAFPWFLVSLGTIFLMFIWLFQFPLFDLSTFSLFFIGLFFVWVPYIT